MEASYNGLSELYQLVVAGIGIAYVLYFFKDLIMPFLVALFLFFLVREPMRFLRARVNAFLKFAKCCSFCTPLNDEDEDEDDRYCDGSEIPLLFSDDKDSKKKKKPCCDCGHITSFCVIMMLIFLCVFLTGFVMVNSIQTLQSGKPSKIETYSIQLKKQEKKFLDHLEHSAGLKGNAALDKVRNYDFMSPLLSSMITIIPSLVSSILFVLLILAFLLGFISAKRKESGDFEKQVMAYIVVKTQVSALAGLAVWVCFASLNVPLAATWGLLTFILNYIPNFGAMIAILVPAPILLLDPTLSTYQTVLGFLLPGIVHGVVGNLVEPFCFYNHDDLQLHPITSLLCVVVWIMLWGIGGGILAVPLTTMMRLFLNQFRSKHRLLGVFGDFIDAFQKPKKKKVEEGKAW